MTSYGGGLSLREWVWMGLFTVVAAGLVIALPLYLIDRMQSARQAAGEALYASQPFRNGDMVRMKAFGTTGMVIGASCRVSDGTCTYTVRFSAIQMHTDVGLFGADGPIDVAPVAAVSGIRVYELEPAS